jgi:rRNA maturation endonuclease Nob1
MWYFISAIQSVLNLKRICKRCGKSQIVPLKDKDQTVACKYCGGELPPPKKES